MRAGMSPRVGRGTHVPAGRGSEAWRSAVNGRGSVPGMRTDCRRSRMDGCSAQAAAGASRTRSRSRGRRAVPSIGPAEARGEPAGRAFAPWLAAPRTVARDGNRTTRAFDVRDRRMCTDFRACGLPGYAEGSGHRAVTSISPSGRRESSGTFLSARIARMCDPSARPRHRYGLHGAAPAFRWGARGPGLLLVLPNLRPGFLTRARPSERGHRPRIARLCDGEHVWIGR